MQRHATYKQNRIQLAKQIIIIIKNGECSYNGEAPLRPKRVNFRKKQGKYQNNSSLRQRYKKKRETERNRTLSVSSINQPNRIAIAIARHAPASVGRRSGCRAAPPVFGCVATDRCDQHDRMVTHQFKTWSKQTKHDDDNDTRKHTCVAYESGVNTPEFELAPAQRCDDKSLSGTRSRFEFSFFFVTVVGKQ